MFEMYKTTAQAGVQMLHSWYNQETGLWDGTGWWNSANILHTLIDYQVATSIDLYDPIIALTFERNQHGHFLNNYYDDEGWWALTWLKAFDLTDDTRYLNMAETIFADMQTGWDRACGGGCWWSKRRDYKNAITNELFLLVASRLYQRTTQDHYLDWGTRELKWFLSSGMINEQALVNDGLNAQCQNNSQTTWTYNQGVILGGLTAMSKINGDKRLITLAEKIADAALTNLVDPGGILAEPCETGDCGADGPQFKGIFMRNLLSLYDADQRQVYKDFILRNADSICHNNITSTYQFGLRWAGPVDNADPARQSSALETLNAALLLTRQ